MIFNNRGRLLNKVSPLLIKVKGSIVEDWFQEFDKQAGHYIE
ncbi:hypothetical protein (plasmid) [Metabacillus dongyingensis]|nr:hypothetical protein [Metabacillus dongyingensis]